MITVGRLDVRGNRVTRARVIERLAGVRFGVPFRQRDLDRARERLERSGLFRSVAPLELAQDADRTRGVLLVSIEEGSPNRLIGVLEERQATLELAREGEEAREDTEPAEAIGSDAAPAVVEEPAREGA